MANSELQDTVAELEAFIPATPMERNYQLDRMYRLLDHLGNPQDSLRVVHVAGTSGKTSTAYFARALLREAGCHVGLTVSPHVSSITERLQIGAGPVSEAQFCDHVRRFLPLVRACATTPSYFEVLVALAFWAFAETGVDYAVVETGVGGLLDGTNTIRRADKVCIISDIGRDHVALLGDSLTEIAFQKAGIVQPGNAVFVQDQDVLITEFLMAETRRRGGTPRVVDEDFPVDADLPTYQRRNWRLAVAAVDHVLSRDGLAALTSAQRDRAARDQPPGRLEVRQVGKKFVLLDGAHNPQKLHALRLALADRYDLPLPTLANFIAGPDDKLAAGIAELAEITDDLVVAEFTLSQDLKKQSLPAPVVAQRARDAGIASVAVVPDLREAFSTLTSRRPPVLLVTGSLYLVGAVRAWTDPL